MGWLRIDDQFEDHEKTEQLSDAAHRLWFRCACWCRKRENQRTEGTVPERVVIRFCGGSRSKSRRLAAELVNARGEDFYAHEHGLWVQVEGGWRFHDWADYQPQQQDEDEKKQELSEKRAAAGRAGGRRSAEAKAQANGTFASKQNPSNCSQANAKQTKQSSSPDPDPDPDPIPIELPNGSSSSGGCLKQNSERSEADPEPTGDIPCPGNLTLTASQRASLETNSLVKDWAIDASTAEFIATYTADPNDRRPLVAWRKCLAKSVLGAWRDPKRRPKPPEDPDADGTPKEPSPDDWRQFARPPGIIRWVEFCPLVPGDPDSPTQLVGLLDRPDGVKKCRFAFAEGKLMSWRRWKDLRAEQRKAQGAAA